MTIGVYIFRLKHILGDPNANYNHKESGETDPLHPSNLLSSYPYVE